MKSRKVLWTVIALLSVLAVGGCAQVASHTAKAQQSAAADEKQKEKRTTVTVAQQPEERPIREGSE
ncbi:MAG: hypothetical protein HY695_02680 [Deltaproteobacteria bacterium]|nr:hypothetical protein [Deltaproteobacteria bacterium]